MSKKSKKKDSRQMEFHLPMSSQEASRVSRSASQENKQEQVTTDISGLRCFESSKSLPRGGLLEKMSKVLLTSKTAWSSRLCALTWKERDTKSGRSIFQLAASVPRTEEKECGSSLPWSTPTVMDHLPQRIGGSFKETSNNDQEGQNKTSESEGTSRSRTTMRIMENTRRSIATGDRASRDQRKHWTRDI